MTVLALETSTPVFSLAVARDDRILRHRRVRLHKLLSDSIIPAIDNILKQTNISLDDVSGFAVGLGPGSFTSLRVGLATVKGLAFSLNKPVVGVPSLDVLAEAVSDNIKEGQTLCVISDAKRQLFYTAVYRKEKEGLARQGDYRLIGIAEVLKSLLHHRQEYGRSGSRIGPIRTKATPARLPLPRQTPTENGVTGPLAGGPIAFLGDGIPLAQESILHWAKQKGRGVTFISDRYWSPQAGVLARLAWPRFERGQFDDAARIVPLYLYPADCQVQR